MNIDSFESERLRKLIADKKAFLKKQTNPTAAKLLQREIMFLENEILPVVLINSTILHGEVHKYVIRCFDEAVQRKCNGLLIYLPAWNEYKGNPIIGVSNPRRPKIGQLFGDGFSEIFVNEIEIHNRDGSGVFNPEFIQIDVNGSKDN